MTLKELRAKYQGHLQAADAFRQAAQADERELTADEMDQVEAELDSAQAVKAEIELAEQERDRRRAVTARLDGAIGEPQPRRASPQADAPRASVEGPAFRHDPARGFADLGEFAGAVRAGVNEAGLVYSSDERLQFLAAASGASAGEPSTGGVLMPPQFSEGIYQGMERSPDNLLGLCDRYTVTGETLTLMANAETKRTTGSRFGGVRGYWRAEAAQMTASTPKLREMKLEPQELYVFAYVTDKLLRGAGPALTQFLTRAATEEITFLASDAIVEGSGVNKPRGYKSAPGTVTVAKEGGQAANTIVAANVHNMWSRCFARNRAGAIWFINQDCEPQLEQLSGADSSPIYLPPGGMADAPFGRLKGRPVRAIEYAETLGTKGDISLCDLGAYAVGTRGTIETAMSIHLRFDYGESAFRFQFEMDGQPWNHKPLTPFKGSSTLSPFVNLAVRA